MMATQSAQIPAQSNQFGIDQFDARSRSTILGVGECMLEFTPAGGGLYALSFAGDAFNCIWYARQLLPKSAKVSFLTATGQDVLSEEMLEFFDQEGIDTEHIRRIPGATPGCYLIRLDNGERSFHYWRSVSAARQLADDPDPLGDGLESARMIYVTGITLAILPPRSRGNLLAALERARAGGAEIALDTNYRPALWHQGAGEAAETIRSAAQMADITLPSAEEHSTLFGSAEPPDIIEFYRDCGASTVVVKDGPGTIHAWNGNTGCVEHSPRPVTATDTTAAGDSFNGGFLAAYMMGAKLCDALALGADIAGIVVANRGALVKEAIRSHVFRAN